MKNKILLVAFAVGIIVGLAGAIPAYADNQGTYEVGDSLSSNGCTAHS